MASGFEVDTGTLDLVRQLAERQAGHLRAIRDYLDDHTSLNDVGGLVMLCLKPKYDEGRQVARDGFEQGVTISEAVAARATETRQAYLDTDRATVERFRSQAEKLGISLPEFHDPGTPSLRSSGDPASPITIDGGISGMPSLVPGAIKPGFTVAETAVNGWAGHINPREDPPGTAMTRTVWDVMKSQLNGRMKAAEAERAEASMLPGQTSSPRDRFEQTLVRRYAQAYDAGAQQFGSGTVGSSGWAQNDLTVRTVQGASDLKSLYGSVSSAWGALDQTQEAAQGRDTVLHAARGEDNTDNYGWAR